MTKHLLCLATLLTACSAEPITNSDTFDHHEDCKVPVIDTEADRPADLLADDWLAYLAARMPCLGQAEIVELLESSDTMFFDRYHMIPGYQDSFGDSVQLPTGMRPNSIHAVHIDLAVPGGHAQIFQAHGVFHFPFGRPIGSDERHAGVINFWHVPRDDDGKLRPVAYWGRNPSRYTDRIDWVFPVGTVFGELMFIIDDAGQWHPFEVRTRTREREAWTTNVFRPFTTAERFASELELAREDDEAWAASDEIDRLIAHASDPSTLRPATLAPTNFRSAFEPVSGAEDPLPELDDPSILQHLLRNTSFQSAKGKVWKTHGDLVAYAPTSNSGGFSIVPRGFNGGLIPVSDESCTRCHTDAGRPFRDYYDNITAYGELWGQDETFTWHPFDADMFLDKSDGDVTNFNNDNRRMRQDFVSAGLVAPYDQGTHLGSHYTRIPRDWHGYVY